MFPPHSLHYALSDSVVSGVFIDTKFYLFSRRNSSGKVCRPLPLYVNSVILNSVPYFKDLLSGGFAEDVAKSLSHCPFEDPDQEGDCDYLSDSDLEEDVEVVEPVAKTHRTAVENQDPGVAVIDGSRNELDHQGKVVVLRSVPYLTFRAIVMYLYTGEIDFAPFGSKENRELRAPELLSKEEGTVPRPSPKSIYRIADMYDMPELKGLAYSAIESGIKSCDAIEETFSRFTSRYPKMIDLHTENLASTLLWSDSQDIQERFNEKLRSFANGEIPHAANVVSTLFGVLARYRASDPSPETCGPNLRTRPGCTWAEGCDRSIPSHRKSMNIALIKSIHHGSFLDMGYRVRKNRIGANQFAFVYLSSSILHGVRSEFDALVHTTNSIAREGGHEVDDDSDYEDEPVPGPLEANDLARDDGIPYHKFLPGAFKTWKALFLYLCFNEITFGPLRSQETPLNFPATARGAGGMLSCSPKSLYHLAQRLGLDPLADLAFHDVISKLTSENIVRELFSRFTSQKYRLVEKQCLLLTSTLKTPKTTSMFQQCIQEVANGTSPHCYHALKLTFGNTVYAIKQERYERRAREEAEREARERAEREAREEAEREARERAEREARQEAERKARRGRGRARF